MRHLCLSCALILVWAEGVQAQILVTDLATTTQSQIAAILQEYLYLLERDQHSQVRRMAQRLSLFTSLEKFRVPEPPRWRTHDFENPEAFHFSRAYHAALNYGDAAGSAYLALSHPVLPAEHAMSRLPAAARRSLAARLATHSACL
jgi:hypothetical protein